MLVVWNYVNDTLMENVLVFCVQLDADVHAVKGYDALVAMVFAVKTVVGCAVKRLIPELFQKSSFKTKQVFLFLSRQLFVDFAFERLNKLFTSILHQVVLREQLV